MEFLKNLPEQTEKLENLIEIRPGEVVSMALSQVESVPMTLFAIPAGESLRSEMYPGDTLYLCLSGDLEIRREDSTLSLTSGDALVVPAMKSHAVDTKSGAKYLEVSLWNS